MTMPATRLGLDLETALMTLVGEGGQHPDPAVRCLALDALVLLHTTKAVWLDRVTVLHLPDDHGVPKVLADWVSFSAES